MPRASSPTNAAAISYNTKEIRPSLVMGFLALAALGSMLGLYSFLINILTSQFIITRTVSLSNGTNLQYRISRLYYFFRSTITVLSAPGGLDYGIALPLLCAILACLLFLTPGIQFYSNYKKQKNVQWFRSYLTFSVKISHYSDRKSVV